ncbi:MAG: SoxR reducing system RseC family protein [Oscillospiraceae bacterium]|nr:SoxR reducing system RseC family protein [Oscillospiraceae bacterium]
MTQMAKVENIIDGNYAKISVARQTACGHDCEHCSGCGITGGTKVYAVAKNTIGAKVGDDVIVESSSKRVLGIVALVYVLPFVGFFIGYALGAAALSLGDLMCGLVGIIGFALFLIPALIYNRYMKKSGKLTYEITKLF